MEQLSTGSGGILVVEDETDIRDALVDILREEGYPVEAARNGLEALEYLRRGESPRLILLDLMMPVMNGWQFRMEQLREPAWRDIPVWVLSAFAGEHQRALLGAAGYIRKPITLDTLDLLLSTCRDVVGDSGEDDRQRLG